MKRGPWTVVFAIAAVLSLGVVACGGDDSSDSSSSGGVKAPEGPEGARPSSAPARARST